MPQQNFVRSFLLADMIIREAQTNKLTIVGSFTNVNSLNFPVVMPAMHVFAQIENVPGGIHHVEVRCSYVDPEYEEILLAKGEMTPPAPGADMDLVFGVSPVLFPRAGKASVELKVDGQSLCSRGLTIAQIERPQQQVG